MDMTTCSRQCTGSLPQGLAVTENGYTLAQADLGLAMGTGTDVAIEASDITLVRGDLRVVVDAIRPSRRTLSIIKSNLFWAFGYNTVAMIAAAGLLNPMSGCPHCPPPAEWD